MLPFQKLCHSPKLKKYIHDLARNNIFYSNQHKSRNRFLCVSFIRLLEDVEKKVDDSQIFHQKHEINLAGYDKPARIRYIHVRKAFTIICVVLLVYFGCLTLQGSLESNHALRTFKRLGHLKLGGPFDMVDINGTPVSEKDLKGKFTLIYFGAAHCHKDCTERLIKLTEILNNFTPLYLKRNLNCWFVSIDPDRDSPEILKEYLKNYHPCIIGVTGTKCQVEHMTDIYNILAKFHDKSPDSDFYIDHSLSIYLLSPDGFAMKCFSCKQDNDYVIDDISNLIRSYLTRDNKKRYGTRLN